jgi:hypothetical protein
MKLLNIIIGILLCLVITGCSRSKTSNASNVSAPTSISGKTIKFTVSSGAGGFAASGTWNLVVSSTVNRYEVIGDYVNVVNSAGTFMYSPDGNKATVAMDDSVIGKGNFYLTFTSATAGTYTADAEQSFSAYQSGSFTEIDTTADDDDDTTTTTADDDDDTTTTTRTYYDLNGITFGNNTFVAVGESGTVRYSSDNGSSWDNGTSGTTREFYEIAYGDNTFVAVGQRGTHSYSGDNGNSWSTGTWSSTNDITGVAFGNNTFIGVSSTYLTKSTDNGSNWNLIGSGVRVYDVTFGNSKFVASGAVGAIQISANNGSNWSSGSSGTSTNTLYGITFGNNKFFSVGNSGKLIISSDNGSTFSNLTSPVTKNIYSVAFGNNIFVGVGYRTVVVSNNDGSTVTEKENNLTFNDVTFGNGVFAAVGDDEKIYTSTDGDTWTKVYP